MILRAVSFALSLAACGDDDAPPPDAGGLDAGVDAAVPDSGAMDSRADLDGAVLTDAPAPIEAGPPPLPDFVGATGFLEDTNPDPNIVEVAITARLADVDLGGGIVIRNAATYNGMMPGPTLRARKGDRIIVHFRNELPEATTIHWHGMRVPDEMDGSPLVQTPVPTGGTFDYDFVIPDAATFWFHPHTRTHELIERGLYASAPIVDPLDPEYDLERLLVLDDIALDPDGGVAPFLPPGGRDEAVYGRYGTRFLTNGRLADLSTATVSEGAVERWRILNAANARTMRISVAGASARVIASEGGLLEAPYAMPSELLVGSGQRFDLEVSYNAAGTAELRTRTIDRNADGTLREGTVVMFSATVQATGVAPRAIPWPAVPALPARTPTETAVFGLSSAVVDGGVEWRINGMAFSHAAHGAPMFTFPRGTVVRMTFANQSPSEHPFHLHGQFFTLVDAGTPTTNQPGLKDTALVDRGESVDVIAYLDNPGNWMLHCHILEHAELGMLTTIEVTE